MFLYLPVKSSDTKLQQLPAETDKQIETFVVAVCRPILQVYGCGVFIKEN